MMEGGGLNLGFCSQMTLAFKQALTPCNRDAAVEEFQRVIGCRDWDYHKEDAAKTAARWSGFLEDMAIKMATGNKGHMGHVAFDAGYNDNSGLAPVLANFLQDESDQGQILVLVLNS